MRRLRRSLVVLLVLAGLGAAQRHHFAGRIEEVDVVARHLVVREDLAGGKSRRMPFVVTEDTRIVLGSREGTLADLRVGDEVAVTYELGKERHHVVEIHVTREAPPKGVE